METDAPLITTIIPTYRRPTLLRRAIRSVLSQTYPHFQVCVYDNASDDETAAVVAEFARDDPRVKYHCHPENIGMSANFTYAMEHIATPYFSILSDDDVLLPPFFETAMRGFTEHSEAILSAGATLVMNERGRIVHVPLAAWERYGFFTPPAGLLAWTVEKHPYITGILFRAEAIERAGLLEPHLLNADFAYEWRLVSRFPYVVSDEPCAIVVEHAQQATRLSDPEAWLQGYQTIAAQVRANESLTDEAKDDAVQILTEDFARRTFVLGTEALRANDIRRANRATTLLTGAYRARRLASILGLATRACARCSLLRFPLRWRSRMILAWRAAKYRGLERTYRGYLARM